ncbi:hypothetical protein [Proteiniclasticum sp.]|nr:hypothetical protein [Proteiniclasticum sp.]
MAKKKVLNSNRYRVMKSFVMICDEAELYEGREEFYLADEIEI